MTDGLRLRARPGPWLAVAAMVLASACQTTRYSEGPEPPAAAIERAHYELLARYGGVYENPALDAYVEEVGGRVLAQTSLTADEVRFVVIDTDVVNAYAIPGATIYVTRGLLTWLNSEAELAGVIAHEIAHLTEDHVAEAREFHREAERGATGREPPHDADATARLRAYSRAHELEADRVGLAYLVAAGYPGHAMRSSQQQFDAAERIGRLKRGLSDPLRPPGTVMATHPSSADRISALTALPEYAAEGDPRADRYLAAIDGIGFGPNENDWRIDGARIVQPATGIEFTRPEGFSLAASAGVVSGSGPGDCALIVDFIPRDRSTTPTQYLSRAFDLLEVDMNRERSIGGFPGAVIAGSRFVEDQHWYSLVAAVGVREDVLMRVLAIGKTANRTATRGAFQSVLESLRPSTERPESSRHVVVVHTIAPDEDLSALAAQSERARPASPFAEDFLRALNAMGPDDELEPGQVIKLIESRAPATVRGSTP